MKKINAKTETETVKKVSFSIPKNTFKGAYSNFALIKHTKREFIVDFIFQQESQAELVSRVIMSPEHTKDFQKALNRNIKSFNENK